MEDNSFKMAAYPRPEKCSTCGKPMTKDTFMTLTTYKEKDEEKASFGPYEVGTYIWCAECILRAMGTPEKQRQD